MPKDSDFSGSEFWGLWLRVVSPPLLSSEWANGSPAAQQQPQYSVSQEESHVLNQNWWSLSCYWAFLSPSRKDKAWAGKVGTAPKVLKIFFLPNYNKILPKYKASLRNSISPPASPPLLFPWLILWYVNLTGTWSTLDIWSNIILDAPARMVLDEIYI